MERWPGGLAHNAFNHEDLEPYTGMLNISDYIQDLLYPHMVSLALDYGSEIMVRPYDVGAFTLTLVKVV
jgi:alpha-L-fucosidase